MTTDITYCSDAEFCPIAAQCARSQVPNGKTITLSKFYEQHILSCKEDKCEYFYPTKPINVITNSYQENKKRHWLFK